MIDITVKPYDGSIQGVTITGSQWQISTDSSFINIIKLVTKTTDVYHLLDDIMVGDRPLYVRVRFLSNLGPSDWSDFIACTGVSPIIDTPTLVIQCDVNSLIITSLRVTANNAFYIDRPVITLPNTSGRLPTQFTAQSSPYSFHGSTTPGYELLSSEWVLELATGEEIDRVTIPANANPYTYSMPSTGITSNTHYVLKVRYISINGNMSQWGITDFYTQRYVYMDPRSITPDPNSALTHFSLLNNGLIYVHGGVANSSLSMPINKPYLYNPLTDEYTLIQPPNDGGVYDANFTSPHVISNSLLDDGTVLVVDIPFPSGTNNPVGACCAIYDPITNSYATVSSMPVSMWYQQQVTMSDGKVLVIGHEDQNPAQPLLHTYIYDPQTDTWVQGSDLQVPTTTGSARYLMALLVLDDKVYACGGVDNNPVSGYSNPTNEVYEYDVNNNTWSLSSVVLATGGHTGSISFIPDGTNTPDILQLTFGVDYDSYTDYKFGYIVHMDGSSPIPLKSNSLDTVPQYHKINNRLLPLGTDEFFTILPLQSDNPIISNSGSEITRATIIRLTEL